MLPVVELGPRALAVLMVEITYLGLFACRLPQVSGLAPG